MNRFLGGLQQFHIGALIRAIDKLQAEADRLHDQLDYNAEFPAEDARALRDVISVICGLASGEPVAWRYRVNNTYTSYSEVRPPDDAYDDGTLVPLYAAPPAGREGQMSDLAKHIESLRSKAAANRGGVTSITVEELTAILADMEDAERYRWLRMENANEGIGWLEMHSIPSCFDAAIDEARRAGR